MVTRWKYSSVILICMYWCIMVTLYHLSKSNEKVYNACEQIPTIEITEEEENNVSVSDYSYILGNTISYILNPSSKCLQDSQDEEFKPLLLLVLVHSGCVNRPQRDAIRNTWARFIHNDPGVGIVLVFLMGISEDESQMKKVVTEGKAYQDMIILDIIDSYRNLSVKSVCGLQWADQFCGNTKYVAKSDDDVYLDMHQIISMIKQDYTNPHTSLGAKTMKQGKTPSFTPNKGLVGAVYRHSRVMRVGLWGLSYKDHPSEFYPDYCSGNLYLMNITVVKRLLLAALSKYNSTPGAMAALSQRITPYNNTLRPDVHFVPFEDVFITGYLAQEAGIVCEDHPAFPHWVVGPSEHNINKLIHGKLVAVHRVHYRKMYDIHKYIWSKNIQ